MPGTINSWNNQIAQANSAITLNAGTNAINIGTDATNNSIGIGTGASVKTVTVGSLNTTSETTINGGTGSNAILILSNNGTTTLGAGSNGTVNVGSGGGTGTTNINSGSGGLLVSGPTVTVRSSGTINLGNMSLANETINIGSNTSNARSSFVNIGNNLGTSSIDIRSGSGGVAISADTGAAAVNIATGAAAKTVTLGSTNSTSSLALRYGTADFTLASATGTIMSALDTGEITYPLQPAFQAYLGTTDSNVTGDGTVFRIGSGNALTEVFDNNSDFNTNGTFTAPVTGKYYFYVFAITQNTTSAMTTFQLVIQTTAAGFNQAYQNGFVNNAAGAFLGGNGSVICQMTAGDTCVFNIIVSGGTKTVEVYSGGANGLTSVGGYLIC